MLAQGGGNPHSLEHPVNFAAFLPADWTLTAATPMIYSGYAGYTQTTFEVTPETHFTAGVR
jgi:hypothetical protein